MKQTIEIEVPDGKKAVWKGNKVVFEDIKLQLPKTWKEFCNIMNKKNYNIPKELYIAELDGYLLSNKNCLNQFTALLKLKSLRDYYRQGWIPTNYNKRHCIVNSKQKYWITSELVISCFLSFQSEEIAKQFLNNFKDLIKQAGDLI